MSPKKYQIECRLKHAAVMLLYTDYNCTEIASLCGFSNSVQFSAMFGERYGMTPTEWRRVKRSEMINTGNRGKS